MRKRKTYLTGQELAEVLPKMYEMRQQGDTLRYIGNKYGMSEPAMSEYLMEYKSYLSGGQVRRIARAIPYLVVNQSKMNFTEEQHTPLHGATKETIRNRKGYLTGRELAGVLPKMYEMHKQGDTHRYIGGKYGLNRSTVTWYLMEYNSYLRGGKVRRIARAIPYLIVNQSKMKFTEEQGRKPEQRGSYTKPKQQEVKRKSISILWGLLTINW
jgi:hypothetical protein